jgi:DNA-binding LacI/PurR family transcriptional regulator
VASSGLLGQYHGAIVGNTTPEDDLFLESTDLAIPLVRFQRTSQRHPTVNSDGRRAGADVADYLVGLGHRRIGLVYPDVLSDALIVRREGFMERIREHGLAGGIQIVYGPFSEAGGVAATTQLLDAPDRPSAIFCPADSMVLGSLYAARRLGLTVPRDLSVIGFDDTDRSAFYDPPLTTVRVPVDRMAGEATALLMGQMQRRITAVQTVWFPCELIIRESCIAWEG